jgi:transketolase
VAEIMAEAGFQTPKRFRRIGIPDVFPDQYGSQASLLRRYEITAEKIVSVIRQLRGLEQPQPQPA